MLKSINHLKINKINEKRLIDNDSSSNYDVKKEKESIYKIFLSINVFIDIH